MRTIFIVLIVIACLAPLTVGCDSSPPVKISTCSPKDYFNNTANKCEPKYQWVDYSTIVLWNDKRLVRFSHSDDYVILRSIIKNEFVDLSAISINNLKNTKKSTDTLPSNPRLEVLLAEPGYYDWQPSSKDTAIPDNAIEAGYRKNKTIYLCRSKFKGVDIPGMVDRDARTCYSRLHYSHDAIYDIMIYE